MTIEAVREVNLRATTWEARGSHATESYLGAATSKGLKQVLQHVTVPLHLLPF